MTDKKYIRIKYFEKVDDSRINPIILTFPNNFPKNEILNNDSEVVKWTLCENKSHQVKDDKLLIGESEKLFFEGKSRRKEKNSSDFIVGVFSKKKRTLSLLDYDALFIMNQKIKKIESKQIVTEETIDISSKTKVKDGNDQIEYLEKKEQLVKDFGTNKSKKLINNRKTNIVKEENISSANAMHTILEQSAKHLESNYNHNKEEITNHKISFMKDILPEFNIETQEVREIFNLTSILTLEDAKDINCKELLKILKVPESLENIKNSYSEFVYEFLQKLSEDLKNNKKIEHKLKYLIFLDYMIKFYAFNKIEFKSPDEISRILGIEMKFTNLLLNKFCETFLSIDNTIRFKKTTVCRHRLICHILVLALSLKNFHFDVGILTKSLKLDLKGIYEYLKEIGCSFPDMKTEFDDKNKKVKKFSSLIVELKAPLKFNVDFRALNNKL